MSNYGARISQRKTSHSENTVSQSQGNSSLQDMANNSPQVKQLKKLQEAANNSVKIKQLMAPAHMAHYKSNVAQLYPVTGSTGAFASSSGRPGGYSNAGTKDAIIDDIFSRVARNDFETALKSMSIGNAKAQLRGSWLSTNNCAICHKQPISHIETRIVATANQAPLTGTPATDFLHWIASLMTPDPLGLSGNAAGIAAKIIANTASASEISELILLIDRSPSNLYIGHSPTNSGIGDAFDHNMDLSDPTDTAPAPASPRASAIYNADHVFAPHIGHAPSSPRRDTDSSGDSWIRSSGAAGWVHSNQ